MRPALRRLLRLARSLAERIGLLFHQHVRVAFSQEGEDLLVARLFDGQATGFYVDVGAHHPTRFSNTYLLYRRGWRGINIDATPGSMSRFRRRRSRDVNLEIAVSAEHGTRDIFLFDEPAINTLSPELAERRAADSEHPVVNVAEVDSAPLAAILDRHLPADTAIDLMTIDVEGSDFEVIRSNDWEKYRPRALIIEVLESSLVDLQTRPEIEFLSAVDYEVHSKLHYSVLLLDGRQDGR